MATRTDHPRRQATRRWLRFGAAAVVLVVLAAGLAIAALFLIFDEEERRARLESAASAALAMDVTVRGKVGWTLGRSLLSIDARDVVLEKNDSQVAEIESVRADLVTGDLLRGNVNVRRMVLSGADINIIRDPAGRFNFEDEEDTPVARAEPPDVEFSRVTLTYLDQAEDTRADASGCQGRLVGLETGGGAGRDIAGEGELRCDGIAWEDYEFSDVELETRLGAGRRELRVLSFTLFGGAGHGTFEADSTSEPAQLAAEFLLEGFMLEEFLKSLQPAARADGQMTLSMGLTAQGDGRAARERSLEGEVSLRGESLTLHGVDLDARLDELKATQRFGLLDVAAVMFAGPLGIVFTKGYDHANLLTGNEGGRTELPKVVADWRLRGGTAHAHDVAAATNGHRIAALGQIDVADRRFENFKVVLLDSSGCAVLEQEVSGTLDEPDLEEPHMIEVVLGPVIDLIESGIERLTGEGCEVVYEGEVEVT
jgi:hypothetical protein